MNEIPLWKGSEQSGIDTINLACLVKNDLAKKDSVFKSVRHFLPILVSYQSTKIVPQNKVPKIIPSLTFALPFGN